MKASDVIFDDNFQFYSKLDIELVEDEDEDEISISILDSLEASEEVLREEYKQKIATFFNNQTQWIDICIEAIKKWGENEYNWIYRENSIYLLNMFILFEQEEEELYGLGFSVPFEDEHGCGLKIKGDTFEIVEIGHADTAFL